MPRTVRFPPSSPALNREIARIRSMYAKINTSKFTRGAQDYYRAHYPSAHPAPYDRFEYRPARGGNR